MSQAQFSNKNSTAIGANKPDPMLAACRDLAVKMLTESLDQFFVKLEETYFDLADKSFNQKQRDDYFAARIETNSKRALLGEQFRLFFNTAFNNSLSKSPAEAEQKFYYVNADPDQLSLVANEEYEESLSADKVVKSIKSHGGEELDQLEMRFARLLAGKDDDLSHNPMSPEAICDAFLQACKQLETGVDARLVAMQAFESELSSQVANVYRQINQYLITQNVQPLPRHARVSKRAAPAAAAAVAAPDAQGSDFTADSPPRVAQTQSLAEHFSHLAQNGAAAANARASVDEPEQHSPGWLSFLDLLQRKAPPSTSLSDENGLPLTQNLLGMLRDTGWAKQLPQLDAMTLELVAMLFEHIFEDQRLSSSMKSLIGRLQIPILKVGMMDADFFARKNHPARQFLDELAFSSIDSLELDEGMPRYEALAEIVGVLLKKYETDVGVFVDALAQLHELNRHYEELATEALSDEVDALAAHELAELAQVTSEQLIKQRIARQSHIPDVIVDFLTQTWQMALCQAYGAQGEAEPEFLRRMSAMDDLLWSVLPKVGADERFKMVNMLPEMLKSLEDGAASVGLSKADSQVFFSQLVQCHAAAIRNGIKVINPVAAEIAVGANDSDAPMASAVEAFAALEIDVEPVADTEEVHSISLLPERGEWVEWLDDAGDIVRLRLSWISPQQTRYLFTNRNTKGLAFLKAELEAVIQSGRMTRLILEGTLTDRAMQGMISELS